MFKRVIGFFIILLVQACTTLPEDDAWPTDLPPQRIFIEYCQNNNRSCATPTETKNHLTWIKRFYHGSILYPTGWNEMVDIVTTSLDNSEDKVLTKTRLDELGLTIVLEWAQDNKVRLIDSQMLSAWANAIATSAEKGQQIEFITRIEGDVDQILLGLLMPEEITSKRYYNNDEDYDDF